MQKSYSVLVAVLCVALAMPLSITGPAVALTAMGRELGENALALNWVTNAFMLGFGSFLMAAGTLADTFGRKRLFIAGAVLFAATAVAMTFAPTIAWIDALRAVQGIGAALSFAGAVAALTQEFNGNARIFSLVGTTFGIGLAFGPMLSGMLVQTFGWRSVFLSVTLVCIAGLTIGLRAIRESRDPNAAGLDWLGAATFTISLTLFTYALLQEPESGWKSPEFIATLAGSLVALVAFVVIEFRAKRAMLDLSLFRYPRFVGVQFLAAAPAFAYVVLIMILPIRFVGVEGYSPVDAGRIMLALSAPMLVVPFLAAVLSKWLPARTLSCTGLFIAAVGLVWFAHFPPGAPTSGIVLPLLVIGFGVGLPWGLMDGLSVSVVPKERAGMATGIFSTTRVAVEGIALAIVTALLTAFTRSELAHALTPSSPQASVLDEAARQTAIGDLPHALAILPHATRTLLLQSYGHAFTTLLFVLSGIAALSALIILIALRTTDTEAEVATEITASCEAA